MTTARTLWNGTWVIHDHAQLHDTAFVPAPADVAALPPGARPVVLALLESAHGYATSAEIAILDAVGNDARLKLHHRNDGTAEVRIKGSVAPPPPAPAFPTGLGLTEAQLLDLTHQGLWVVDPEGHTGFVNARMAAILSSTPADLARLSLLSVVHEADRSRLVALFDGRGDNRGPVGAEAPDIRLRSADGTVVWTNLSTHRIANGKGLTAAVVAVVDDTTAWHHREQALLAQLGSRPGTAADLDHPTPEPELDHADSPAESLGHEAEPVREPARAREPFSPNASRTVSREAQDTAEAFPVDESYRAVFLNAPVGMALIELDGWIREANPAMVALLDPHGTAKWPMRLTDLVREEEQDELTAQLVAMRSGSTARLRVELPLNPSEEGTVWTLLSAAVVHDAQGQPAYAIAQAEDITERRVAEHDLVHQTLHDPLTGLGNRLLLRDQLQHALSIAHEVPFAVMFLDLDQFKSVNDTYGHDAGDALLVGVSQRLRRIVRAADTVARLGGDEFAIIAQGIGDRDGARILAEKVRASLRAPFRVGDVEIVATASVGVVLGNREYATGDQLLRDADIAMYRAKDGGRDRHELFDDEIRLQEIERLETERTLHATLEGDGLKLHYQPIVDLHTGRAVGAEALLRISESGDLLTPDAFLGVAEDSRLILDVGAWVLREVTRQLGRWSESGYGHLAAWVNVSGLELASPRFPALVQRALSSQRVDASRLHVECTENVLLEASPSTIEHLRALASSGVSVGIDDFGTGYSSLGYLRDLPVSFLKIDSAFTRRLDEPGGASMVEAIVSLGRSLGLTIVAEGVESLQQMESLATLGCDLAQGHLFARPQPLDSLTLSTDASLPWN